MYIRKVKGKNLNSAKNINKVKSEHLFLSFQPLHYIRIGFKSKSSFFNWYNIYHKTHIYICVCNYVLYVYLCIRCITNVYIKVYIQYRRCAWFLSGQVLTQHENFLLRPKQKKKTFELPGLSWQSRIKEKKKKKKSCRKIYIRYRVRLVTSNPNAISLFLSLFYLRTIFISCVFYIAADACTGYILYICTLYIKMYEMGGTHTRGKDFSQAMFGIL